MKTSIASILPIFLGILLIAGCVRQPKTETTSISAPTMVCGSCEGIIKKAVYKVDGVKDVEVDLKAKTVTIEYVPLQTNVETIERTISEAGYDANDVKRDPVAYERLPDCCRIDG
jgi:mercuric ion binding protein